MSFSFFFGLIFIPFFEPCHLRKKDIQTCQPASFTFGEPVESCARGFGGGSGRSGLAGVGRNVRSFVLAVYIYPSMYLYLSSYIYKYVDGLFFFFFFSFYCCYFSLP